MLHVAIANCDYCGECSKSFADNDSMSNSTNVALDLAMILVLDSVSVLAMGVTAAAAGKAAAEAAHKMPKWRQADS